MIHTIIITIAIMCIYITIIMIIAILLFLEALRLLASLRSRRCEPDLISFNAALGACHEAIT